jgi:RNA polymerase sigma factor (TIGR02999 family)
MSDRSHRSTGDVTRLLKDWSRGDQSAFEELVPLVYDELHRLARRSMRRERADHTLQTTALVNEAYLNLAGKGSVSWEGRAHFLAVASQVMRRLLVSHARRRGAGKRGGAGLRLALEDDMASVEQKGVDLVALDDALSRLQEVEPEYARLVELRFFGGLTLEEAGEVLQVSPATAKRRWVAAKAWLYRELTRSA